MRNIVKGIEKIQEIWGVILFVGLTAVISLQVLSRYVIQEPFLWSEEAGRFLLFWVALTGAAISVKRKRHFVIDFFKIESVKKKSIRISLQIFPDICILLIGLIMVIYGYQYCQDGALRMGRLLVISMKYVFAAIPISGVTIIIYSVFNIIETIKKSTGTQKGER